MGISILPLFKANITYWYCAYRQMCRYIFSCLSELTLHALSCSLLRYFTGKPYPEVSSWVQQMKSPSGRSEIEEGQRSQRLNASHIWRPPSCHKAAFATQCSLPHIFCGDNDVPPFLGPGNRTTFCDFSIHCPVSLPVVILLHSLWFNQVNCVICSLPGLSLIYPENLTPNRRAKEPDRYGPCRPASYSAWVSASAKVLPLVTENS